MRISIEGNGLTLLNWPGNSPDFGPIEDLWGVIEKQEWYRLEKLIAVEMRAGFHDDELAKSRSILGDSVPKQRVVISLIKAVICPISDEHIWNKKAVFSILMYPPWPELHITASETCEYLTSSFSICFAYTITPLRIWNSRIHSTN